jgi:putative membrane protein
MKRFLLIAACLLLAGHASAQSAGEKSGVNSTLGISPTTPDFVKEAAISDMFEIESSKLATERADGAAKKFASQGGSRPHENLDRIKGDGSAGRADPVCPR